MKLYAISVTWAATPMHPPLIDGVLGLAGDWIRLNPNFWMLKSEHGIYYVQELLKQHLKPGDNFLVIPVNPSELGGYYPAWAWQWMGNPNVYLPNNPLLPSAT